MPKYVRVKVLDRKHIIDIPEAKAARFPDRYKVIDPVPVSVPRPAELFIPKPKRAEPVEEAVETVTQDARFGQSSD